MSNELASMIKYNGEGNLEEAYNNFALLAEDCSGEDKVKAIQVKVMLEECYRLTLSMSIADAPQVAWLRKDGAKNRKAKGKCNPFKGVVKGAK